MKVDKNITSRHSNWVFDEHVAPEFDDHVRKSVPDYERCQELAARFSDWFTYPGATVLDLGAATGETLARLHLRHAGKRLRLIGYDNSKAMIEQAVTKGIHVEFADLALDPADFPKASYAVALYTLQFLRPHQKWTVVQRLARAIESGGGFFVVEKVVSDFSNTHDIIQHLYWDFKRENGLSPEEVLNKANALRGAMFPQKTSENEGLLRQAFREVECVFRNLSFAGWICIK